MVDFLDFLPFVALLPSVLFVGYFLWRQVLSPAARAGFRAYGLGYSAGLAGGDNYHGSPFGSDALTKAWRDGLLDGRLDRANREDRQKLRTDLENFERTARNRGNPR